MESQSYLIEFYGEECPHCEAMKPIVEQIERELETKIEKLEVWHNPENQELMMKLDVEHCDGVPLFYNKKSKKTVCGEADHDELLAWATAEQ